MIDLTTTQRYRHRSQQLTGSLAFYTCELKKGTHKYWAGELAAHASTSNLKKGIEYTIKTVGTVADWSPVGGPSAATAGAKFIADDGMAANAAGTNIGFTLGNAGTPGVVTYGDDDVALEILIKYLQTRLSVVKVGAVTNVPATTASVKVNIMAENTGVKVMELQDLIRIQMAGAETEMEKTTAKGDDTDFAVEEYVL